LTGSEKILIEAGESIRKSIQVSLMEGRPCLERVETTLQGLRQDLKSQMERELSERDVSEWEFLAVLGNFFPDLNQNLIAIVKTFKSTGILIFFCILCFPF
jgi:hypothetical protein